MDTLDAFAWADEATKKLQNEFTNHLLFVGLQGSRARSEAQPTSDIDLVVLLDSVSASDLARYHTIIQSLPHYDLACGFIGSSSALASWPRHELFQFYHDTKPLFGKLPEVEPFTKNDALQAAQIGASGIYHAACHTSVFSNNALDETLQALYKGAFFVLQALQFARTGIYPHTKAELAKQFQSSKSFGTEARILDIGRNWNVHRPTTNKEQQELLDLLLRWSEQVIEFEF